MKNHSYNNNYINLLPGLLVSFLVATVSKLFSLILPTLGAATIAILLGILLGNTVLKKDVFNSGTKIVESKLLELSIVLLGTTVTFQTIIEINFSGGIFILGQMIFTLIIAYTIGKRMKFSQNMSMLMAGGNAVCGSSAIAAIAPAIRAKEEEKGQIITLVNLLGTLLMLSLPILSNALFRENFLAKSALIGGTLQSVGQVVASASMIDTNVVKFAMLFKIMRIMLLVVVVYIFGKIKHKQSPVEEAKSINKRSIYIPLPWYIIGFLILCITNSLINLPTLLIQSTHSISNWFEITALAAIGLRLDFQKFVKEGPRFLVYGLSVGFAQVISAVILIYSLGI